MSEIRVKYRLNQDDLFKFNMAVSRKSTKIVNFVNIILILFLAVESLISKTSYAVTAFLIIGLCFLIFTKPVVLKNNTKKIYNNYFALKTDIIVEFYNDHIVEKNEGGETQISFEEHFPLESVKNVIETDEHFLFFISPFEAIILPKRALQSEDMTKINNLLLNVFNGKYEKQK